MKVDAKKLKEVISQLNNDIKGNCIQSGVCIGKIGSNQIHIFLSSRDKLPNIKKYRCVSE